jgi:hypothetical protein
MNNEDQIASDAWGKAMNEVQSGTPLPNHSHIMEAFQGLDQVLKDDWDPNEKFDIMGITAITQGLLAGGFAGGGKDWVSKLTADATEIWDSILTDAAKLRKARE